MYIYNMSKVTAYYHIVFCTKGREMTLPLTHIEDLYRFIWKQITSLNCELIRIGGIQNHIHALINLHPSVSLSLLVKNIKGASSAWMRQDGRFHLFCGWAAEYFACTIAPENKVSVIEYIKNQRNHHSNQSIDDEFKSMYHYAALEYDSRDMQ